MEQTKSISGGRKTKEWKRRWREANWTWWKTEWPSKTGRNKNRITLNRLIQIRRDLKLRPLLLIVRIQTPEKRIKLFPWASSKWRKCRTLAKRKWSSTKGIDCTRVIDKDLTSSKTCSREWGLPMNSSTRNSMWLKFPYHPRKTGVPRCRVPAGKAETSVPLWTLEGAKISR